MANIFKKLDKGANRFFGKVEHGANRFFTKTIPKAADTVGGQVALGARRVGNTLEKAGPALEMAGAGLAAATGNLELAAPLFAAAEASKAAASSARSVQGQARMAQQGGGKVGRLIDSVQNKVNTGISNARESATSLTGQMSNDYSSAMANAQPMITVH
jgi:hypothetical protein